MSAHRPDSYALPVVSSRPWRTLSEREGSRPPSPELPDEPSDAVSRRSLLKLLGSGVALAGLEGCFRPPPEKILPYSRKPAGVVPGVPQHYATAFTLLGRATGLVVESFEGRPTKVEGNELHPTSAGATGRFEQALLPQLYDPHRARLPTRQGQPIAWKSVFQDLERLAASHAEDGGARLRFLVEPTSSLLHADLRRQILERFPRAGFHAWAAGFDAAAQQATQTAFGRPLERLHALRDADVIACLDDDLLDCVGEGIQHLRAFADRRSPEGAMNRLYVVEATYTQTGTMADHRLRLAPSRVGAFALTLAAELTRELPALRALLPGAPPALEPHAVKLAQVLARDLLAHRGRALVTVGAAQPAWVHALALAMNDALGAVGATLRFIEPVRLDARAGLDAVGALVDELSAGAVDTLVVTAFNPLYSVPADAGLADAFGKVPNTVCWGAYQDETAARARWHLPAAHLLESWGDTRAADGTASLVQPLISPLFDGIDEARLLGAFTREADLTTHQRLQALWRERTGRPADFERRWGQWLADGVIPDTQAATAAARVDLEALAGLTRRAAVPPSDGLELRFHLDAKVHDGRFANNAWLQELPDPITKLTWDNAALVSPATAAQLGLRSEDVARLERGGVALEAPVEIIPGMADGVVALALGYGRSGAEEIARDVGVNVNTLRRAAAPWIDTGLQVQRTGKTHRLATTQGHWDMDGRPIALSVERERLTPETFESQRGELPSIFPPLVHAQPKTPDKPLAVARWAMGIDLSRCIGCSACVVACQAENNIPTVGKEQVLKSREMHWLRVDRYFEGPIENPTVVHQPLMCVHCEKAPCEYVCPVNATVHSDEGLNEMVYNRCVGTRFCSNNCPYKVRRFNYLNYTGHRAAVQKLMANPDVTVRARGVMEKCTYCVQRIERARIDARIEGRDFAPGEVKTACQQACPSRAIEFGDLNDEGSAVAKRHKDLRRYDLLHELGTQPRTVYLARVRNPHPDLVTP